MGQWTEEAVQQALGMRFRHPELLHAVFIDRKVSKMTDSPLPTKQELAHMGDSLVEFIARSELVRQRRVGRKFAENWRGYVVSNRFLDEVAIRSGLYPLWVRNEFSEGPSRAGGTLFEALVGAMVYDHDWSESGIAQATRYLERVYLPAAREVQTKVDLLMRVSAFQNIVSASGRRAHFTIDNFHLNGTPRFHVRVKVPEICEALGEGASVLEADAAAVSRARHRFLKKHR